MTEPVKTFQYLRLSMPDPDRAVFSAGVRILDYFHTQTGEYLGSENVEGNSVIPYRKLDIPDKLIEDGECFCGECWKERHA